MKAFFVAVAVLVLGDLAINHGDATHATLAALGSFWRWLCDAASGSIFDSRQ